MNIIQTLEAEQAARLAEARPIPEFHPGDTVIVNVKVKEGERARVQAYEGVCIARSGSGLNENFTVRKIFLRRGSRARVPGLFSGDRLDQSRPSRQSSARQSFIICATAAANRPESQKSRIPRTRPRRGARKPPNSGPLLGPRHGERFNRLRSRRRLVNVARQAPPRPTYWVRASASAGWRSVRARRSFSMALFSICRTRSFEIPNRSPRDSSVAASSVRRRAWTIRNSRSDRTVIASCSQSTRRLESMTLLTSSSGRGPPSIKNSMRWLCAGESASAIGALRDTSGPESRVSINSTSAFETPIACAMIENT